MAASSISETKRVRYLLGLCSPAEREHLDAEFFENEDAFEEMLTVEDDLIDAYARGELAGEERRIFEVRFASSLRGRDRVRFARAFADTISPARSVEPRFPGSLLDIFKTFQRYGMLRTTTAAVIVLAVVLACLLIDRGRMTDELGELRAQSAELTKRTEVLQQSSVIERPRTKELVADLTDLRTQSDEPSHRKRGKIKTSNGYGADGRANKTAVTLDGVDVEPFNAQSLVTRNMSSSGGATVRGTAKDPQGNVLSGATVTLTDLTRNFTRTLSTNEDGVYVFNAIPPGTYSLELTAQGFKTASVSGLAARVDTPTVCNVQLEIGAVSETVEITSGAEALINTSDATLGNSFERKHITELPLNARNVAGLLSLQPAVTHSGFVNGGRANQANITLDGVDINAAIPSWVKFHVALESAAVHEDYRVTIKSADGRLIISVDWIEPLTPNQTTIDTPAISIADLPSGDYVLLLMGKEPDGSFVKVAEYSFKLIKNY